MKYPNKKIMNLKRFTSISISIFILLLAFIDTIKCQEKTVHIGVSSFNYLSNPILENDELTSSEKSLSFNLRLDAYLDLSSKMQVNTGIVFQQSKITQIDYSPTFGCDFNGSTGSVDFQNSWVEDRGKIYYLGIPIEVKRKFTEKKNHIYGIAGIIPLFKINSGIETSLIECMVSTSELESSVWHNPNTFLIFTDIGFGFEFEILNKRKLFLEPRVSYSITKVFEEAGISSDLTVNTRLFNLGLRAGFKF